VPDGVSILNVEELNRPVLPLLLRVDTTLLVPAVPLVKMISGLPVADPGVGQPAELTATVAGSLPLPATVAVTGPGVTFVTPFCVTVNEAFDEPPEPPAGVPPSFRITLGVIEKKKASSLRMVPIPN